MEEILLFSDRENIYSMAERVRAEVGEVDILINNAGIVQGKRLLDSTDEVIIKTFQVNLFAHFWVSKTECSSGFGSGVSSFSFY